MRKNKDKKGGTMRKNKAYWLTILFTILNVAANVLYNFAMALLLEALIAQDFHRLIWAVGVNFFGVFIILATDAAMKIFQAQYIVDQQLQMRKIQISRLSGYEISNLTSDMDLLENNFFTPYFNSVEKGLQIAMALAALLWIDWRLACVSLLLFGVIVLTNSKMGPYSERMVQEYSTANETFLHHLTDLFNGRKVYAVFDFSRGFKEAHLPLFRAFNEAWISLKHRTIVLEQISALSSVIAQVVNLFVLALLIFIGAIPISLVLTAGNLTGQLYNSLASFPELMSKVKGARPLLARLSQEDTEDDKEKPILEHELTASGLTKRYGDKTLFHAVNASIRRGENARIVGPSGSGKTTLLNILFGIDSPDEGTIQIDGNVISPYHGVQNMAYITQNNYIFENTVRFNITLGDAFSEEEVDRVAHLVGIDRFVNQDGLDMKLLEHGENISGGERQRIALARALIRKKDIILVDETTSNLDTDSAREIEEILLQDPNITFVYVKHDEHAKEDSRFDHIITL